MLIQNVREQARLPSEYRAKGTRSSIWISEMQRFVIFGGVIVVFKTFCDEILEDTLLMASH